MLDGEPELAESRAPLALLANDPDVSSEISSAARAWLDSVTYGLCRSPTPSRVRACG